MFRLSERASRWLHLAVMPLAAGLLCAKIADVAVARIPRLNRIETVEAPVLPRGVRLGVDPRLRVLTVGDATLARFEKDEKGRLKRTVYADLLHRLQRAGARTVLFDLIFNAPTASDAAFAKALRETSLNVTLMTRYLEPDESHPNVREKAFDSQGVIGTFDAIPIYDPARMPNVRLGSAWGVGPVGEIADQDSHVLIGAMPLQHRYEGPPVLHGAFQAALQQYGLADRSPVLDADRHLFLCGGYEFQLGSEQEAFVLLPPTPSSIPTVELSEAMRSLEGPGAKAYKDALVIVGRPEGEPLVKIPEFGEVSGEMFVALMANTALSRPGDRLIGASPWHYLPIAALLAAGAFALGFSRRPAWASVGFAVLGAAAWLAPDPLAASTCLVFPRLIPVGAVAVAGLAGLLAGVSPLFRAEHRAVGQSEEATVLFLDVRGSTRLLETLGADRYRKIVGDLLTTVSKGVASCGGLVERTLGDGCLIVFRDRRPRHHARCAADAVPGLLAAASAVSERHGVEVSIGIGFETGIVTGGYVTEGGHRVWSSAGLAVNLAQRLQSASESLGARVVVGPVAARLVGDDRPVASLGLVEAKGFADPIPAFSLVDQEPSGI